MAIQRISNSLARKANQLATFEEIPLIFPVASLQPYDSAQNKNTIFRQGNVCFLVLDLYNSSSSNVAAWTHFVHIPDSYLGSREIVNTLSCRRVYNVTDGSIIRGYTQIFYTMNDATLSHYHMQTSFAFPAKKRVTYSVMFFIK